MSDTRAGQAVYTPLTLRLYDLVVHGISNPLLWRCPTPRLHAHVRDHVRPHHLEVGPGSGLLLRGAVPPGGWRHLTLLDLNPHCLDYAARRLQPQTGTAVLDSLRADLLRPLSLSRAYDSIGLMYVLHCLPGAMDDKAGDDKAVALDHLGRWLAPDGVLYGATLLGDRPLNGAARRLMAVYNRKGVFCNHADSLDSLESALHRRFAAVSVTVNGACALFTARAWRNADPVAT